MNFKEELKKILGKEAKKVNRSFNIIGEIGIIEIPNELKIKEKDIAKILMKVHKNIKTVVKIVGATKGTFRIKPIKWVYGLKNFETIHKENGCLFKLKLNKVYFNPRLGTERQRIYNKVKDGEIVIDMFAGVGPFSIEIAKHTKVNKIYAIEINPIAYKYLVENIKLNKVEDKVIPILGDCREKIKELPKADRILMGYFPNTEEYLPYAISKIKKNGVIHYHNIAKSKEELIKPLEKYKVHILKIKKVKSFAPKIWHWVVDFKLLQ